MTMQAKKGKGMTNKEFAAMLEALKIIVDKAESKEEIKKALDEIQSQVTRHNHE